MKHIFDIYEGIFDKDNIKNVGNNVEDAAFVLPTAKDFIKCDKGWFIDISYPKLLKIANKYEFFNRKDFVKITLDVIKIGYCWKNVIRLYQKNNRSYSIELPIGDYSPLDAKHSAIYRIEMWYDDPQEFDYILDSELKTINEGIFDKSNVNNVGNNIDSNIQFPTIDDFCKFRTDTYLTWSNELFMERLRPLLKPNNYGTTQNVIDNAKGIRIYIRTIVKGVYGIDFYLIPRNLGYNGFVKSIKIGEHPKLPKSLTGRKTAVIWLLKSLTQTNNLKAFADCLNDQDNYNYEIIDFIK